MTVETPMRGPSSPWRPEIGAAFMAAGGQELVELAQLLQGSSWVQRCLVSLSGNIWKLMGKWNEMGWKWMEME